MTLGALQGFLTLLKALPAWIKVALLMGALWGCTSGYLYICLKNREHVIAACNKKIEEQRQSLANATIQIDTDKAAFSQLEQKAQALEKAQAEAQQQVKVIRVNTSKAVEAVMAEKIDSAPAAVSNFGIEQAAKLNSAWSAQ